MALVPGGSTQYVRVESFCLDVTEVTVDDYVACVKSGACSAVDASDHGPACNWTKEGRGKHPMNCVSFWEAEAHRRALGKRLPTTEQWEFAAGGGPEQRKFPRGDEPPKDQLCWSGAANGPAAQRKGTCPAGSMPGDVGRYGHLDLAGNVREWTATPIRAAPGVARAVSTVAEVGRAWSDTWAASQLVGGYHSGDDPSARADDRGFRCSSPLGREI
jgi:formylglycine-generating enzyme